MKTGLKVLFALGALSMGSAGCDNRSTSATVGHSTVMPLSDPESAAVISRVNAGEIETAQVMRPYAAHSDVIAYADRMVAMHQTADGLLLATGVGEEPNAVAMEIDGDFAGQIAVLNQSGAVAAEPAYLQSQAAMHRQVLLLIDCAILPGTADESFRKFVLDVVRPKVRENFELASQLAGDLMGSSGGDSVAGIVTQSSDVSTCEQACDAQVPGGFSVGVREAACH